jgi:multiple sugar transport system permease protein/N,N'-diacetylchitobiose transport system permease protein
MSGMTLAAPRRRRRGWPEWLIAAAFITPAAITILLVVLVPLVRAAWMSLFDISLVRPGQEPFVGLGNYTDQLTNPDFWASVFRALYFTLVSTMLELTLGLALALLMDQPLRGRWILRTLIILPWALPTVVNALMWRWIDNAEYGALNALLTQLHLISDYQVWLSDPDRAMWMVIIADVWKMTPLVAILLLAGLQSVDRELLEAAQVDGASAFQAFFRVLMPLIAPVVLVVLVLRTMEAFKVFDLIWIMTGGGPANATQTVAIYAYQTAYQGFDFGSGAALGYLIAMIIMFMAAIYLRLLGRMGR